MNKSREIVRAATLICALSLLTYSSCSFMLQPESVFARLDRPNTELISLLEGDELLSAMDISRGSRVFYGLLTPVQTVRILNKLDTLILNYTAGPRALPGTPDGDRVFLAARAKADMLLNTSSLVFNVVNNMADPLLDIESYQQPNAGVNLLYRALAEPVVTDIQQNRIEPVVVFFLNMYGINKAYSLIAEYAAPYAVDGGDLQIAVVSTIFGSIVGLPTAFGQGIDPEVFARDIFDIYQQAIADAEANGTTVDLNKLLEDISARIGVTGDEGVAKFKEEVAGEVVTITGISDLAGYRTLGAILNDVLTNFSLQP